MNDQKARRGFMAWPDDTVEEVADGEELDLWKVPGIYLALITNGLPLTGGGDPKWSQILDFSIGEHGVVTAYTQDVAPHEHPIPGEAVQPLTDWLKREGL